MKLSVIGTRRRERALSGKKQHDTAAWLVISATHGIPGALRSGAVAVDDAWGERFSNSCGRPGATLMRAWLLAHRAASGHRRDGTQQWPSCARPAASNGWSAWGRYWRRRTKAAAHALSIALSASVYQRLSYVQRQFSTGTAENAPRWRAAFLSAPTAAWPVGPKYWNV